MNKIKAFFKTNAKLKNIIGKDLIQDDITAINELVKNSLDAGASKIDVSISKERISISDNGIGMSEDDIINKWLNIAHSDKAKENGKAGNKGIGRFSCDKLGKKVSITSKTFADLSTAYNFLEIDWLDFEKRTSKDQIGDIPVYLSKIALEADSYSTIINITDLRELWDLNKIEKLEASIEKLIKPFRNEDQNNKKQAKISINGKIIENKIYEYLDQFGTFIMSDISEDWIEVALFFKNEEIFSYKKKNNYNKLYNLEAQINYMTPYLKAQFRKQTGIEANKYGSVFFFNNGFRVYPYGESKDDYLGLAERKTQGYNRFLGPRDILGFISVNDNEYVVESSSREGIDKPGFLEELRDFIETEMIKNMEYYLEKVVSWDSVKVDGNQRRQLTQRELEDISNDTHNKFANYISKKAGTNVDINKPYLKETIKKEQVKVQSKVDKLPSQVKKLIQTKEEKADIYKKENQILQASKPVDNKSAIFHDISNKLANTVSCINLIAKELNRQSIDVKKVQKYLLIAKSSSIEASDLSRFGIHGIYDLLESNKSYEFIDILEDIIRNDPSFRNGVKIHFNADFKYRVEASSLEVCGFLNNIYSNSVKAKAKNIYISFMNGNLEIYDDGEGLSEEINNIEDVYVFGHSSTGSSGMGMYYINEFVKNILKSNMKIDTSGNKFKIIVELNNEYIA